MTCINKRRLITCNHVYIIITCSYSNKIIKAYWKTKESRHVTYAGPNLLVTY